jgi:hypothetical protein
VRTEERVRLRAEECVRGRAVGVSLKHGQQLFLDLNLPTVVL